MGPWVRPRTSAHPALSQSYIINMVSTDTAEETRANINYKLCSGVKIN